MLSRWERWTVRGEATAVMLLVIWVLTACNLVLVPIGTGGQPNPSPELPASPAEPSISAATPAITVQSTLPAAIREKAQPIQFKSESSPETVQGELNAHEAAVYVVWAQAGQMLTINTDGFMQFTVLDENGMLLAAEPGTGVMAATLPANGDYYVIVEAPAENGRYPYTLHILISHTLSAPAAVQSQPTPQPERILIDESKTSTTIPGTLHGDQPQQYQLPATAGETLVIFLNARLPAIQIILSEQDGTERGRTTTGIPLKTQLPITQDYLLTVSTLSDGADENYTLTISMVGSASPTVSADQEALVFDPGSTSTHVSGVVSEAHNKTYTFSATSGQRLVLDTAPAGSGITITVLGADGSTLGWVLAGIPLATILPSSQIYFIDLIAPDNADDIDYAMTVTIE